MTRTGPTFDEALRDAIAYRNMPLERLQAHLRDAGITISMATLSYWQNGRSIPARASSIHAVTEIEIALGLEPDSLLNLLKQAKEERVGVRASGMARALPVSELVVNMARAFGLSFESGTRVVSLHCLLEVGPDGVERTQSVRSTLVASRAGVASFPIVHHQFVSDAVTPTVEAVLGCTIGRTLPMPDRQLQLAEVVLNRPLTRGQAAMAEYRVFWAPSTTPTTRHERSVARVLRELVLQVDFDPKRLPASVTYSVRNNYDDPPEAGVHLPLKVTGSSVQHVVFDAPRGVHGLHWSWDEEPDVPLAGQDG